jgi:dihydrodipicolinate synthase/N-acetylneuraminate lyase
MTSMPRLMAALVTPFDRGGEIDLEHHRHNLGTLWDQGVRGFLIGGSTGEGPYLEPGERHSLISEARATLGKKAVLVGGVAAESVRQAAAMVKEAAEGGADAVLVITPTTLTRNRMKYVEGFYQAVADKSPLPTLLYSVPGITAFEIPEDLVGSLASHPNIVGIKDSGGHPVRLQRILASVPDDFTVFTGSTQALTLALTAGAHGGITASTNYMADRLLATIKMARTDPRKAHPLQRDLSRISAAVEPLGIPGVKAASQAAGLKPGYPRLPLQPLSRAVTARLIDLARTGSASSG